jgi:RHS repeat-associated protein
MTDSSGALVADSMARFLPFGGYRSDGSEPVDGNDLSDRGFTGHYENREIGLTYMQARYYAPELRRFASADTIVPDPGASIGYNRFAYANQNPLKFVDPDGHCPKPPEGGGPTICVALFIEPATLRAGPFTVHGDGRTFDSDSAPGASRGYIWIDLETLEPRAFMNSSGYVRGDNIQWFDPLESNEWVVSVNAEEGSVSIVYDLALSGYLAWGGTAPHIDGEITFWYSDSQGVYDYEFTRDGFPSAEAYYHDGEGHVQVIFQDPAVNGDPFDLNAIHQGRGNPLRFGVRKLQEIVRGRSPEPSYGKYSPAIGNDMVPR